MEKYFENVESARMHVMSYGRAIEVIEPQVLRKSVIDFAEQIIGFYGGDDTNFPGA